MQEQNFTELLASAQSMKKMALETLRPKMEKLADKNKKDLQKKELPDYLRTPNADELIEMRQWAIDYKKFNTKASKREIRKATQQHFHIRIFR